MDRRDFLKTSGAVAAGGLLAELGILEQAANAAGKTNRRPNIIFVMVDEMRFPTVFPAGVHTPGEFLRQFMPNVFYLWQRGAKFESYYSAGNACSPARATIASGLYPHQQWLLQTRTTSGPSLQPNFPTYGKLLRHLGYQTPYFGKWHLSNPPSKGTAGYLENYGFQGMTNPDPTGTNGQGAADDVKVIAKSAAKWLRREASGAAPFCITVSFVNPHDKEFFWAGSEAHAYYKAFKKQSLVPFNTNYKQVESEARPPSLGFPKVPPNWETYDQLAEHGKPPYQQVTRSFQDAVWGGAPDDPRHNDFSVMPWQGAPRTYGIGVAPFSYWERSLDMYTLVQQMVDKAIGDVLAAIPTEVLANSVIVFAADHGDYAGAHGFLSGKLGTAYEEAIHIPLVVNDPTGQFVNQPGKPRKQLTSSVDLMPMLVTLGNRGSTSWRKGRLADIYDERLNLVELLRDPDAAGRDHILFATDEIMPKVFNYLHAPTHVLAVRTHKEKLVTYGSWVPGTTHPIPGSTQLEFYDYATAEGRAETRSHPKDPRAKAMAHQLFTQYVPEQFEAPLPTPLKRTVAKARASYIEYEKIFNTLNLVKLLQDGMLGELLGYGNGPF